MVLAMIGLEYLAAAAAERGDVAASRTYADAAAAMRRAAARQVVREARGG